MDWENFLRCGFTDWGCCTSGRAVESLVGWFCLAPLSRGRRWPTVLGSPIHYASIHPSKHLSIHLNTHPSTHPNMQPAGHPRHPDSPLTPAGSPLRLRAASWRGSQACCRGRGPAWWAAAGPARSWWSATCSGCTPGSGWLSAGSGTTGRWCPGDCRVGEGGFGSKCTESGKKWDGTGREGTDMERGSGH